MVKVWLTNIPKNQYDETVSILQEGQPERRFSPGYPQPTDSMRDTLDLVTDGVIGVYEIESEPLE